MASICSIPELILFSLRELEKIIMAHMVAQAAISSVFSTLSPKLLEFLKNQELVNFWGVRKKLERLKENLSRIQSVLNDAQARILDKPVEEWMDDLRELAYDMEDIVDEMNFEAVRLEQAASKEANNTLVRKFLKFSNKGKEFPHYITFNTNLKSKMKKVLSRLDAIAKYAHDLGLKEMRGKSNSVPYQPRRLETSPYLSENAVRGRIEEKKDIVELLLASSDSSGKNYSVIPIVGMGGIGKTTLAQLVFEDEKVKNRFELRSWACVSDIFDIPKVTRELIECATKESCSDMSLGALQGRLKDMVRNKTFLFVLDDLWSVKEWERLEAPLNCCANGSKLLVTTRNSKIANAISTMRLYELGMALFKEKAFGEGDRYMDRNLEHIGMEIVKKCKGMPLAVKVLGGILRGTAEERWESILKCEFWQSVRGEEDDIFPPLRMSYHYLPSPLKRCFEYLSLFPTDYKFQKDELVRIWLAEGFVEAEEGRLLEDIGSEYYFELQRRSLIQNDNKMHDLVHSLACLVSRKFYCRVQKDSKACTHMGSIRHSSLFRTHVEVSDLELLRKAKRLHTILLLSKTSGFIDKSWDFSALCDRIASWSHLRVLDLSDTGTSKLPSSIGNMKHLRYLNLSFNRRLQNLPDLVVKLNILQALDLRYCESFNKLPEHMGSLQSLRYLNLSGTSISSLPSSICKLSHLQTLDLYGCETLHNIHENIGNLSSLRNLVLANTSLLSLPNSICKLEKLQELNLSWCHQLSHLPSEMGNLQSLKNLNLDATSKLKSLPDSLVKITCLRELHLDSGIERPMQMKLNNLETLKEFVVGKETWQRIGDLKDMNNIKGSLVISNLENVDIVEESEMADLKSKKHIEYLEFKWSPLALEDEGIDTSLVTRDEEHEVKVLEALEPHPKSLISLSFRNYNGGRFPKWMFVVSFSSLTSLEMIQLGRISRVMCIEMPMLDRLEITKCPRLRDVSMAVPKLSSLIVEECHELTKMSLIPSLQDNDSNSSWIDLPQLNHLVFGNCPSLRDVPMAVPNLLSLEVKNCTEWNIALAMVPRLLHLELDSLPHLTSLSDLRIPVNSQGLGSEDEGWKRELLPLFTALHHLSIKKCEQLRSLAMDGPLFPTLSHLSIIDCQKLESLFVDGMPATLDSLTILGCPELKSIPHVGCHLTHLAFDYSPHLKVGLCNLTSLQNLVLKSFPQCELLLDHQDVPPALTRLSIGSCPNLTSPPKALHNLISLEKLFLSDCPQLVSLPEEGIPPMLTHLHISYCKNLRYLPKDFYTLTSLQELLIYNCPELEAMRDDQLPPNLERLLVSGCPYLEQMSCRLKDRHGNVISEKKG